MFRIKIDYNDLIKLVLIVLMPMALSIQAAPEYCPKPLNSTLFLSDQCLNDWQRAFMAELGCEVNWLTGIPLKRREKLLVSGKLDFVFGLTDTPERREGINFSRQVLQQHNLILARDNSPASEIKLWCDTAMKNSNLVLVNNRFVSTQVTDLAEDASCVKSVSYAADNPSQLYNLLRKDRADFTFILNMYWNKLSETNPEWFDGLSVLDIQLWVDPISFGISKKNPVTLLQAINNKLNDATAGVDKICSFDVVKKTYP